MHHDGNLLVGSGKTMLHTVLQIAHNVGTLYTVISELVSATKRAAG